MNDTTAVTPDAALAGGHNARKFDQGNDWKGETVDMSVVREACAANPGTELQKRPIGTRPTRHVLRINQELWYDFDVSEKVAKKAAEKAAIKVKTITIHDTGGPGRKRCPACSKYVGVRVGECACGHKFAKDTPAAPVTVTVVAKEATETTETTKLVAGRGSYVPMFHRTGVYDASATLAYRSLHKWDGTVTIMDSGPFDTTPESLDMDGLRAWVQKVVGEGKRVKKKLYTPGAMRHMIRSFMGGITSSQGEKVMQLLDVVFTELKWPLTA